MADSDRTASLMTPAKLAQVRPKVAASPAAWLDQLAADAGHQHMHRMAELQGVLETHARARAKTSLAAELVQLGKALPRLDFGLLRARGWWARLTGKGRDAGTRFAAQFEKIDQAMQQTAGNAQALQEKYAGEAAATDRALVEVEVECQALEKIIDQGGRWLQDMQAQLKTRRAGAMDAQSQQQIKDDAARCEILVARLKLLRDVIDVGQRVHQQAQAAAAGRALMLQMLQRTLAPEIKTWHVRLWTLASAAAEGKPPPPNLEGPLDTHQELQLLVKQVATDSADLQAKEQALAATLVALGQQLKATS
jgi:hypothetical protein